MQKLTQTEMLNITCSKNEFYIKSKQGYTCFIETGAGITVLGPGLFHSETLFGTDLNQIQAITKEYFEINQAVQR